ncbi:hypothetical protein LTV02_11965 [Nocardia yamanashiensis]|uniref:hypothetical protein n=1 Tax=Nocardia yamanashiensis TaxID=209247 RepID=UPI001E49C2DC|nr:hypothetical protein [Nocardia yamanashiensis]UGT44048.1 hypothetical protein LTV02_11965 [Nocardia yamanashiensis]
MDEGSRSMHPALAVALAAVSEHDESARVVDSVVREDDGAAAVNVRTDDGQYVTVILRKGEQWLSPGLIIGGVIPTPERRVTNFPTMPLAQQSSDMRSSINHEFVWHAVTGTAALDVVSVRVLTTLESCYPEIGNDGLVLALIRAQPGERPLVTVTTRDGREESDYRED